MGVAEKLKLKAGSKIHAKAVLYEGYRISDGLIIANVGVDKIEGVMQHFIMMHEEPLFFILEIPAPADEETEIRPGVVVSLHKDVYYMDG